MHAYVGAGVEGAETVAEAEEGGEVDEMPEEGGDCLVRVSIRRTGGYGVGGEGRQKGVVEWVGVRSDGRGREC